MKTIVIVEDNPVAAGIYRSLLAGQGFAVEVATDGETGVETVKRVRPDAVLLDLILPRMDGTEVLRQIRAAPETSATPVVLISNAYSRSRVDDLWAAGATLVLTKAASTPKDLLKAINSVVAA
jgi:CheY-like chemotaxis protein